MSKRPTSVDKWEAIANATQTDSLLASYRAPCAFQSELRDFLVQACDYQTVITCIEVGSAFGVTSALLPSRWQKHLLDQSATCLAKAKSLFSAIGQPVLTRQADILNLSSAHEEFDLVFSAGLLEHFGLADRRTIVQNMFALCKHGGRVCIAVPNHGSLPYRLGYLYLRLLGRWLYPREIGIKVLRHETKGLSGVHLLAATTLDRANAYHYLPKLLKPALFWVGLRRPFPGYLKVFLYAKQVSPSASAPPPKEER